MLKQNIFLHSPLHLWVLLSFFFFSVSSQIPLGSKLSVKEKNYWVSPNGNFAFGLFNQSDQPNLYYAGIRFNSVSIPLHEQTVVWTAGADVSFGYDSFLHLSKEGDLILFDSLKGLEVWSSNTSHFDVVSASLLDNGNLVLLNQNQSIVWQSFQTPSDTLLPGQNLSIYQTLRAASRNSVSSYYSLSMDSSGQLKLSWETNITYWKSEPSYHSVIGTVFTEDGALKLLDRRSRPVWSSYGEDHNDASVFFRFLRLDVDGNLRMYSWVNASKSWRPMWQAVKNQCKVFATCGLRGVCVFTPSATTLCKCPFGAKNDSNFNCLAPYKQSCSSGTTMVAFKQTFLYGIYPPNDLIIQTSFEQCRNSCLHDLDCTSVTVTNDGTGECRMKKTRFISGYEDPSVTSISYVKVCLDPVAVIPLIIPESPASSLQNPVSKRSHAFCVPCLVGTALGVVVVCVLIQIVIVFLFLRRRKSTIMKRGTLAFRDLNSRGLIAFSYSELKDVTKSFNNLLGPKLFKGSLPNNQRVVIKDVKGVGVTIEEKQFRCAVSVLGSIHHKNLLKLEGYCCTSDHRFLVYEYAKNGSVRKWIEDAKLSKRLTWRKRMEICVRTARAMAYLHMGCREFVSHGNMKWENVVLDEKMETKVTEFGLGRFHGYRTNDDGGDAEEDVVKFGEMLVSMLSGQLGGWETCRWVHEEWSEGRTEGVVDARIEGGWDPEELERVLRLAFWCVQGDKQLRPGMGEVVKVLEGMVTVDPPPSPFTCPTMPVGSTPDSYPDVETN